MTVPADATVSAAADILLGSRISAAPVVDADGKLVGIVSEADLMNRPETGTVPAESWLQRLLTDNAVLARDYIRSHSHHVADVMTREVITAGERTELAEIAQAHGAPRHQASADRARRQGRRHRQPRQPAARPARAGTVSCRWRRDDEKIARRRLRRTCQASVEFQRDNVVVDEGVVHLWGHVTSASAKDAVRVAVENVSGVKRVVNKIVVLPVEALFPS